MVLQMCAKFGFQKKYVSLDMGSFVVKKGQKKGFSRISQKIVISFG